MREPPNPRLFITHGLPGAGKSHVALQLAGRIGAIRLRSDVERKRLAGLRALDDSRAAGDLYGSEATRRTYERLADLARGVLMSGWPAIVDAAFLRRDERRRFAALAAELSVPFAIIDCRAPDAVLRERIAARQARGDDASEADLDVLQRLRSVREPLETDEAACAIDIDTSAAIDAEALAAAIDAEALAGAVDAASR